MTESKKVTVEEVAAAVAASEAEVKAEAKKIKIESAKKRIKSLNIKSKAADFKEALEVTRTIHKNKVAVTCMSELASAIYCANANDSATMTQLTDYIVNVLKVDDCYHKCDHAAASDTSLTATKKRHTRHFKHTIKTHYKASTLYSYNEKTDSLVFSDKYKAICLTDNVYRSAINELIKKIKAQYKTAVKKTAVKKSA